MKDTFTKLTDYGRKETDNLCESIYNELTPDNTVEDFVSMLMTGVAAKIIGEDCMNMTIGEVEKDPEKGMIILERLFRSNWYDIYSRVTKPEELMA